ncbi:CAMK family protein kinase, partial [Metarhizium majus ARSEF 297]
MDAQDLIARVYPFSIRRGNKKYASEAIKASPFYVPPLHEEPKQEVRYGRDDRERTEPPDKPGDRKPSEFDGEPCIEVRFSKIPRSSYGVLFGCSRQCDVVLPDFKGISNVQFSLTFDDQGHFIVKDIGSLLGTEVTYDDEGGGRRRRFHWIFQIVVATHDLGSQEYMDKVNLYRQGTATTEDLFSDLNLPLRPDTEMPTGAHTPHAAPIYLRREIGKGNFGVVTHYWNVSNGEEYALKQPLRKVAVDRDKWLEEADTLSKLSHDNIIKVFWANVDPYPQLSLEYIPGGSLDKCHKITVTESVSILRQILSALVFLHERRPQIVHRDIKPDNILVRERTSDRIEVVLGDFGVHGRGDVLRTICGTEPYAPPEIWEPYVKMIQPIRYSSAVDIWSLGMVMYELLLGFPKYQQYWDQTPQTGVAIASRKRQLTWCERTVHSLYEEYRKKPDALKQLLISSMLQLSSDARDSAQECYYKAMALPQTIVKHDTVPYGGILWREDTIVYSSTNTEEKSTIRNEELIGERSTGQDECQTTVGNVIPTTDWSGSGEIPGPRRSLLHNSPCQTVDEEAVGDKEVEDQAWQRSDAPSPSFHSKARTNLKRSTIEMAPQSPSLKRRSRGSISQPPGYSCALLPDAQVDNETAEVAALLQSLNNGVHPYIRHDNLPNPPSASIPSGHPWDPIDGKPFSWGASARSVPLDDSAHGPVKIDEAGTDEPCSQSRHEGQSRFGHHQNAAHHSNSTVSLSEVLDPRLWEGTVTEERRKMATSWQVADHLNVADESAEHRDVAINVDGFCVKTPQVEDNSTVPLAPQASNSTISEASHLSTREVWENNEVWWMVIRRQRTHPI